MLWFRYIIQSFLKLFLETKFWLVFGQFLIRAELKKSMSQAEPSWKSFSSARAHHYHLSARPPKSWTHLTKRLLYWVTHHIIISQIPNPWFSQISNQSWLFICFWVLLSTKTSLVLINNFVKIRISWNCALTHSKPWTTWTWIS